MEPHRSTHYRTQDADEKERLSFRLDPDDPETVSPIVLEKEELKEYAEEFGFPSLSAFLRSMIYMGMRASVDENPYNKETQSTEPDQAATIREFVPEGEENAVDMTDEFWDDILRNAMLDVVENDPEINRDGFMIHK